MNVRIINTDEIKLLFQLFDYNDPDEMIAENTRDINKGKIDIFGLFQYDFLSIADNLVVEFICFF